MRRGDGFTVMILKLILIAIILSVILLIAFLFLSAVLRRVAHGRQYAELDRFRDEYRAILRSALPSGSALERTRDLQSPAESIKWQALEEVLLELIRDEAHQEDVKGLFVRLGYVSHYESRLGSRNRLTRAKAIDMLGKMLSGRSLDKLLEMLDCKDPEIVWVTIRALGSLEDLRGLKGILDRLPDLYDGWIVTRKTVETVLLKFGRDAVPILIEYAERYRTAKVQALLLHTLKYLPDGRALSIAVESLESEHAETRAKALALIEVVLDCDGEIDAEAILPLCLDPMWFVRMHAARVLGSLRYSGAADNLEWLLTDEKWYVRKAAAQALTMLGNAAIPSFLNVMRYQDSYIRGNIRDVIVKTGFIGALAENLDGDDPKVSKQSRALLDMISEISPTDSTSRRRGKVDTLSIRKELVEIKRKERRK